MNGDTARCLKQGLVLGLVVGLVFLVAQILVAPWLGYPPTGPLRLFASMLFGPTLLTRPSTDGQLVAGTLLHLGLSASYGILYGGLSLTLSADTRHRFAYQAGLGLLYGAAIWLVNFQLVASWLYPWVLDFAPLAQLLLHVFAFGLPLGVLSAAAERHGPYRARPDRPPT